MGRGSMIGVEGLKSPQSSQCSGPLLMNLSLRKTKQKIIRKKKVGEHRLRLHSAPGVEKGQGRFGVLTKAHWGGVISNGTL